MKKFVLMTAIVCAAACVNAAAVTWNWDVHGGGLFKPSSDPNEEGSGVNVSSATMYLFTGRDGTEESVYKALMSGTLLATVAAEMGASSAIAIKDGNVDTDTYVRVTTSGDDTVDPEYFVVIGNDDTFYITMSDFYDRELYNESFDLELDLSDSGQKDHDFTADSSSFQGEGWYAVPEPTAVIFAQPTPVDHTTFAVYTNGILSAEIEPGKWAAWSNETATVVYTAQGGYYFADGSTAKTNALDTTVSPATVKGGTPAAPAEPSVKVARPQQRYPWNGIVDVPYRFKNWPAGGAGYKVKFTVKVGEAAPVDGGTTVPAAGGTVTGTYAIDFKKLNLPLDLGEATVKAAIVAE